MVYFKNFQNQNTINSISHKLMRHAEKQPDRKVYTFVNEESEKSLSFIELYTEVTRIAHYLKERFKSGDRVIILFKPGLEFISVFLGCLVSGVVAVPLYPPKQGKMRNNSFPQIIKDCGAKAIFGSSDILEILQYIKEDHPTLHFLSLEMIPRFSGQELSVGDTELDSLAFLQYTSGSTGVPKGVKISHRNLIANQEQMRVAIDNDERSRGVIWLPPYHDMGLAGGILQPLYVGFPVALMSPMHFIQKPIRWLENISKYKASISGGPNFAYDLCIKRISKEDMEGIDLSCWRAAFNGAEPISANTINAFSQKFSEFGFNKSAFFCCYGMAEATLMISGRGGIKTLSLDKDKLSERVAEESSSGIDVAEYVSCGTPVPGLDIKIINPDEKYELEQGKVGEIVVRGENVASGYWEKDDLNQTNFNLEVKESNKKDWMKTGDLGFFKNGELFISGRQKDLIIIRGKNYYPQDIEKAVHLSHPDILSQTNAAFSISKNEVEQLVVFQEVRRDRIKNLDSKKVFACIKKSITDQFELQVSTIVLFKPATLPKTISGKIRRFECRDMFESGNYSYVERWSLDNKPNRKPIKITHLDNLSNGNTQNLVEQWLINFISNESGLELSEISGSESFANFGLDSLQQATMSAELSNELNIELSPELLNRYESIEKYASHVAVIFDLKRSLSKFNYDERKSTVEYLVKELDSALRYNDLAEIPEEHYSFTKSTSYLALKKRDELINHLGSNPFFLEHEGVNKNITKIGGRQLLNYSSNNFLGLNDHPKVVEAAKKAIEKYGTSVSASRLISGEKPLHRQLECRIAQWLGVDDAVVYVGANTANVSTVGHLFSSADFVFYDEHSHDSLLQGIKLAGANSQAFAHNDWNDLEKRLKTVRNKYEKVLIFIEGLYSMDGDMPNLPKFIEIKKKYKTWLMVDECLSIGVVGKTGRGISECYDINRADVDIWMGGVSKAFASCGGYIAGSKELIHYLKYTSPGFIFTTGMSPANAASALAAMEVLEANPEILENLNNRIKLFMNLAKEQKLNTGECGGAAIVPIVIGDSMACMKVYEKLYAEGINVQPIIYPAVAENSARLRFSLTANHTNEQIHFTIRKLVRALDRKPKLVYG